MKKQTFTTLMLSLTLNSLLIGGDVQKTVLPESVFDEIEKIQVPSKCPDGISEEYWKSLDDEGKKFLYYNWEAGEADRAAPRNKLSGEELAKQKAAAQKEVEEVKKELNKDAKDRPWYLRPDSYQDAEDKAFLIESGKLELDCELKVLKLKKDYPHEGPEFDKKVDALKAARDLEINRITEKYKKGASKSTPQAKP